MALPSSSAASASPSFGYPVTEKLTRNNFREWRAQILSALRGAQLAGYLDGTIDKPAATVTKAGTKEGEPAELVANPAHAQWVAQDQ